MKLGAEDLGRLSALLDHGAGLTGPEREAWLAGLSGDAARLRPALARMFAREAACELDDFLEQPPQLPAADAEPAASDFAAGEHIGPYRLLRPVGRGGMGEVWLATRADGQLKRSVALKLPILSVRRSVLAQRFERERDILGALIHPHIARLYDAGIADDGQPFMALEYVEGTPITQAADERALDAPGRVRLLRQVMEAVQYAHANLVIHRDLKPGNVLVGADGQAKLLDFGIAKLVEGDSAAASDSELTRLGGRALTLRYAAPELVAGAVATTAVDVWALGVLLHELLTGQRPFGDDAGSVVEQEILTRDPVPPSQRRAGAITRLSRSRAADLDTIVLKALKKEPAQRYAGVGAFADDLDRWLRSEPVLAQRDSLGYRTRRFIGRNRVSVAAAALATTALLATASVAVLSGLQARAESARALAARDFMIDMFLKADRDLSPGQDITARQLLAQGYRTVVDTLQDQPLLQTELLLGIGDALDFMEELPPADLALQQAAKAYQRLGRPDEAARVTLARAAMRCYNVWDVAAAGELMAQALAMHPAPAGDDEFMARYAIYRAYLAGSAGDFTEEKAWHGRAGPHADRSFRDNTTRTVMAVRTLSRLDGKYGERQRGVDRLNALLVRLASDPRARPGWVVGALDDLGQIEFAAGRYGAALQRFDAGVAYCEKSADPRGIQCIYTQYMRSATLLALGHEERALGTVPPLLDRSRISDSSAQFALRFTLQAGLVLLLNGQLDRHPALATSLQTLGDTWGPEQWRDQLRVWLVQVRVLLSQGQPQAAQALARRAQALLQSRRLDPRDFPEAYLLDGLAAEALGQADDAVERLAAVHAGQVAAAGADHPRTQLAAVHRARALWAARRRDEALLLLDRALPVLREAMGADAPVMARLEALRRQVAATEPPATPPAEPLELYFQGL